MTSLSLSLVVAASLTAACSRPTYTFESRPYSPAPTGPAERCYREKRVEVAGAQVDWERHRPGWNDTIVTSFYSRGGLVLYRGGERLDARAAIEQIGEAELAREYDQVLSRTASDYRWYPVWRNTTVALSVVGAIAVTAGSFWLLSEAGEEDASNAPAYLMLGGLGVSSVSLVTALLAYKTIDGNIEHERNLTIFSDAQIAGRLADGARRHNQRVARRCGAREGDLVATESAKRALGAQ